MKPSFRGRRGALPAVRPVSGLQAALAAHRQGDLVTAAAAYDAILQQEPRHVDALHLRGVLACDSGDFVRAAAWMAEAVALRPDQADFHSNLGHALAGQGDAPAALASYQRALALQPALYQAWLGAGNMYCQLGRLDEARQAFAQAVQSQPDQAQAYASLGNVWYALGDWQAALACHDQAIARAPAWAEAHLNRGNTLLALGQHESALVSLDQALALQPGLAQAHMSRGNVLRALHQPAAALASHEAALQLAPELGTAWYNCAVALQDLRQYTLAIDALEQALARGGPAAEAWQLLGMCFNRLAQPQRAVVCYDQVLALQPQDARATWNKAVNLLLGGEFERGWPLYEARWAYAGQWPPDPGTPRWRGQPLAAGQTLLLLAEQGLGDTLQFCRYAIHLADHLARQPVPRGADSGPRVLLMVQPGLLSLLQCLAPQVTVLPLGQPWPAHDLHSPLLSVPLALGPTAWVLPAAPRYVQAPADRRAHWQAVLGPSTRRRAGLVWRGNPRHENDAERSVGLAVLLAALPAGWEWVSLQKGALADEQALLQTTPGLRHLGDALQDFADTAAVCEQLEVVISVDTSVAHLSAALGRPTCILLPFSPDWRWQLQRSDSPWYPSARLYRQPAPGDWAGALAALAADLA